VRPLAPQGGVPHLARPRAVTAPISVAPRGPLMPAAERRRRGGSHLRRHRAALGLDGRLSIVRATFSAPRVEGRQHDATRREWPPRVQRRVGRPGRRRNWSREKGDSISRSGPPPSRRAVVATNGERVAPGHEPCIRQTITRRHASGGAWWRRRRYGRRGNLTTVTGRRLTLILFVYISLDFANPLMPGAVQFDGESMDVVQADRVRTQTADAVVSVTPIRETVADLLAQIQADRRPSSHRASPRSQIPPRIWRVPPRSPDLPPSSEDH